MPLARSLFLKPTVNVRSRTIVNVGGKGDCGFRSIAAGILDNLTIYPKLNNMLLAKILHQHFSHYPHQAPVNRSGQAAHTMMARLISTVPIAELIQTLAFTLRQLAVEEMMKHPEQYPGAFVCGHENTSCVEMCKSETWIDESSIAALAKALDMPIEVRLRTKGKELSVPPFKYQSLAAHAITNPVVVIELENHHYQPLLLNPSVFKSNSYDHKLAFHPIPRDLSDYEMSRIIQKIHEEETRIHAEFERTQHRLNTMVGAGELTKKTLINLYINGMKTSDYLQGRIKHVDKEHHSNFFSRAIAQLPNHSPMQTHEEALIAELTHALARALSLGQISAEDLFLQVEEQQTSFSH